ncbi:MAG: phosphatidate cytidylyltransferase [Treponema sp.]|nr:phosphatidate cytidylyltransferase [Treponema sp.]
MNKQKIIQRLLIFFAGVPLVVALVIFLPQYNHLALNIFVVIVSSLGAVEFALMLRARGFPVYVPEAAILGSLSPLAATFIVSFDTNSQITQFLFIAGAFWVLVSEVFYHKSRTVHSAERTTAGEGASPDYSLVLNRLTASLSVMIYPGLLLSWVITMSTLEHSIYVLLTFIFTVMSNDSMAWVSGMLFGKNNRGVFSVSPNKSIAGYVGGMTASIGICIAMAYAVPKAFVPDQIAKLPSALLLGFFSGITVILGDLAESAIKRSSGFKDSGNLFPGRGGVLDSTDSVALTAPLFYVLYRFFF